MHIASILVMIIGTAIPIGAVTENFDSELIESQDIVTYVFFNNKCKVLTENGCSMLCENARQYEIYGFIEEFWTYNTKNCPVNGLRLTLMDPVFYDSLIQFDESTNTTVRVVGLTIAFTIRTSILFKANAFAATLFQRIELLTLDNVFIQQINYNAFIYVTTLIHLTITRSSVVNFENEALYNVGQTLVRFEYDGVDGERNLVDITGTSTMARLTEVVISVNLADTINSATFAGLTCVENLTLSGCHITSIGANSFDVISASIRRIDLSNNQLTTLPVDLFAPIKNMDLQLAGNRWHCDCQLISMARQWILRQLLNEEEFVCNTPECISDSTPMDAIDVCVNLDSSPCRVTQAEEATDSAVWIEADDKVMFISVAIVLAVLIFMLGWWLSWMAGKGYMCHAVSLDWRKQSTSTATGGSQETLERRTSSLTTVSAKSYGLEPSFYEERMKEYETPVTNHYTTELYTQPLPPLPPPNAPIPRRIEYEEGNPDDYYCAVK